MSTEENVERLQRLVESFTKQNVSQMDKIKELEAEIERLRGLLRPFAALPVDELGQCLRHPGEPVFAISGVSFTATDVLHAREALEK